MKILVVSGFLGAGKTTFISELSQKTKTEFVVMENEYGEEGIDGSLLQKEDRLKVWELTEGCICCSLKGDFASSILTIANTLNPEYLVVEPTGVGLLSSIMHNIGKIEYERIKLLQPICIVDCHCVHAYLERFGEIYKDQIKSAKCIVLSKLQDASKSQIEDVSSILQRLNPKAQIVSEPYNAMSSAWWQGLFGNLYNKDFAMLLAKYDPPNLETYSLQNIKLENVNELLELLVATLRGYFGLIYRAKGYAPIGGQWTRFDIVNKRYSVSLCQPMQDAKAVFIGENIQKTKLNEALNSTNS